jgi:phenylacetate-coenzyme A ligase PaaK-like adenylate-forming protein
MNKFNKVYESFKPMSLAQLDDKQVEQLDRLIDYIKENLPKYETKEEQKAIFQTLIGDLEDTMYIYQDGWK